MEILSLLVIISSATYLWLRNQNSNGILCKQHVASQKRHGR